MKKIYYVLVPIVMFVCGYYASHYFPVANTHEEVSEGITFDLPTEVTEPTDLGYVTVNGTKIELSGPQLKVGDTLALSDLDGAVPYFDKEEKVSLNDYGTGYKLIHTVPSLDTPVCTMQTKQLEFAAKKFPEVQIITISNDTPFALKRFCSAHNITNLATLSDARTRQFATNNGLLMKQYGLFARSIMIVDKDNKILYVDYADEVTSELDTLNALAFLEKLMSK